MPHSIFHKLKTRRAKKKIGLEEQFAQLPADDPGTKRLNFAALLAGIGGATAQNETQRRNAATVSEGIQGQLGGIFEDRLRFAAGIGDDGQILPQLPEGSEIEPIFGGLSAPSGELDDITGQKPVKRPRLLGSELARDLRGQVSQEQIVAEDRGFEAEERKVAADQLILDREFAVRDAQRKDDALEIQRNAANARVTEAGERDKDRERTFQAGQPGRDFSAAQAKEFEATSGVRVTEAAARERIASSIGEFGLTPSQRINQETAISDLRLEGRFNIRSLTRVLGNAERAQKVFEAHKEGVPKTRIVEGVEIIDEEFAALATPEEREEVLEGIDSRSKVKDEQKELTLEEKLAPDRGVVDMFTDFAANQGERIRKEKIQVRVTSKETGVSKVMSLAEAESLPQDEITIKEVTPSSPFLGPRGR